MHFIRIALALALLVLALVGCAGGSEGGNTPSGSVLGGTPTPSADVQEESLTAILATTVLRLGSQRVAFLLTSPHELVTAPEATISTVYLEDEAAGSETKQAKFSLWPYGVRGSYSTQLSFDRSGEWRLDITVPREDGTVGEAHIRLDVQEEVGVADVGALPPFTRNKTIWNVEGLDELSSAATPDPELYTITILEAVASGKPTVVVFSTPAFCVSPTCGPQMDVLRELKDRYHDEANFIHVELYDNPHEVLGDLARARYSPLVSSWGFAAVSEWTNESWTYVLGRDGRIAVRFQAFVPKEELEQALEASLHQTG